MNALVVALRSVTPDATGDADEPAARARRRPKMFSLDAA